VIELYRKLVEYGVTMNMIPHPSGHSVYLVFEYYDWKEDYLIHLDLIELEPKYVANTMIRRLDRFVSSLVNRD
jgi:hypothetical protein